MLTAFEEHLFEGYSTPKRTGRYALHSAAAHLKAIETHVAERVNGLSKRPTFDISYSVQFPHTDTVCVDLNNALVTDTGSPYTAPATGWIHNLAQVDADVIFIKTSQRTTRPPTLRYRLV